MVMGASFAPKEQLMNTTTKNKQPKRQRKQQNVKQSGCHKSTLLRITSTESAKLEIHRN